MKKIKIMFAFIAVLTVVGGTLAFKANAFAFRKVYTVPNQFDFCTVVITGWEITIEGTPALATNIANTPCISTFTKHVNNVE